MSAVAETLKQLRSEAQMTMREGEEAARQKSGTSVSRNTISSLERGVHKPRCATLGALAWAYGGESEYDPKTIMNLWRLEYAQKYADSVRESGKPENPRGMFLAWALGRDGAIAGAGFKDEQLEIIDIFLDKETSEAKRRHLTNERSKVERGEYEPSNFGGRLDRWRERQAELDIAYA